MWDSKISLAAFRSRGYSKGAERRAWMRMHRLILGVVLTIADAVPLSAVELPLALSIDEAKALALRVNPSYRQAQAEVQRAAGSRQSVEPWFPENPVVDAAVGPREAIGLPLATSYQVRLEQRVDLPGQRSARLEAADEEIRLAERERDAVATQVRAIVLRTYVGTLAARRKTEVAEQEVGFLARAVDAALARVEAGAASEIEHQLAVSELGQARVAHSQALGAEAQAMQQLRAVLNLPYDREIRLTSELRPPDSRRAPRPELLKIAAAHRRDLLALRQEEKAAEAEIDRLKMERLPQVILTVNASQDSPTEYWVGPGLMIRPTIWQRFQGPIAAAQAERDRARIAAEAGTHSAERELWLALDLAERRRNEVSLYEGTVLTAAERSRDLVFEGWRSGKFDIFRVLVAERELVDARLNYLDNLLALWVSDIEIDIALGVIE